MAPHQSFKRLSTASSQHTTHTPRLSLSTTNPNIFSDENALDSLGPTPDSSSPPSESNSALQASSDRSPQPHQVHRQSIVINDSAHERGNAVEYELSNDLRREGSSARKPPHRTDAPSLSEASKGSISNPSTFAMSRTQSPYQGATGPSHPYGMYPQGTGISRNPSSATISNARAPERTHAGASGPTQPYGMYPQSTVPEDETILGAEVIQPMSGFPGRGRNYQRRFGPDSDEAADIVGPDGYTEQLPAYTRYANDIPPKARNPTPGIPDGEPNQPGESRDTLNTITSEDSDPRRPAVEDSSTQLNTPAAQAAASPSEVTPSSSGAIACSSEGGHFKELVKERGKRRVCFGKLPTWLCMVFLVLGACLVGGMIGGMLGRAKAVSEDPDLRYTPATFSFPTVTATVTTTSLVDAVPISSPPADLPTLLPGSYQVPLKNATKIINRCLQHPDEELAWGCTAGAMMELSIIPIEDSDPMVLFNYSDIDGPLDSTLSSVRFGPQPPVLNDYTAISLMNATDHLDKGPAYVFHGQFDKLVILPEDSFPTPESWRQRRDDTAYQTSTSFTPEVHAPFGHKPWFCFWNGTLLEGFIFVTQEVVSPNQTFGIVKRALPSDSIETSTSTSTSSTFLTPSITPSASSRVVTPSITPSASSSLVGYVFDSLADWSSITDSSDVTVTATVIPSPPQGSEIPEVASEAPAESLTLYDNYPAEIKIEERRNLQNEVRPYCQQMLIMEDGSVQSNGLPRIDLSVDETGEILDRRSKKRGASSEIRSNLGRRGEGGACVCEWIADGT